MIDFSIIPSHYYYETDSHKYLKELSIFMVKRFDSLVKEEEKTVFKKVQSREFVFSFSIS